MPMEWSNLIEDEHVQIAEITRHENGHDLALAIRQNLIAAGVAIEDEVHVTGDVAFLDQIRPR